MLYIIIYYFIIAKHCVTSSAAYLRPTLRTSNFHKPIDSNQMQEPQEPLDEEWSIPELTTNSDNDQHSGTGLLHKMAFGIFGSQGLQTEQPNLVLRQHEVPLPIQNPFQEPIQKHFQQPNWQQPYQQPNNQPYQQPNNQPYQPPNNQPYQQPNNQPYDLSNQQPNQQPDQQLNQQLNQQPDLQSYQQLNNQPYRPPNNQPYQQPNNQPYDLSNQQKNQQSYQQPDQQPFRLPLHKPFSQPIQKPLRHPIQNPIHEPFQQKIQYSSNRSPQSNLRYEPTTQRDFYHSKKKKPRGHLRQKHRGSSSTRPPYPKGIIPQDNNEEDKSIYIMCDGNAVCQKHDWAKKKIKSKRGSRRNNVVIIKRFLH